MIVIWNATDADGNFKATKILTHHTSDVTGLCWTRDNLLVSCGIDCRVHVYDSAASYALLHSVQLDTLAKGLSLDPTGFFVACQTEDAVAIISTADWAIEKSIPKNADVTSSTFFCRPDWSPDGSCFVASNFYNESFPVSCIFERNSWDGNVSFVGHQAPIECSRFSPVLYIKEDSIVAENRIVRFDSVEKQEECCFGLICVGSQDGSVSLWSNIDTKPLLVVWDIFSHSALDVCWNSEGDCLFICSFDGSVAQIRLKQISGKVSEIPRIYRENIISRYSSESDWSQSCAAIANLPQSVLQLEMQQIASSNISQNPNPLSLKSQTESGNFKTSALTEKYIPTCLNSKTVGTSLSSCGLLSDAVKEIPQESLDTLAQQKLTTTKDGKKRITPIFVKSFSTLENSEPNAAIPISAPIKKSLFLDADFNLKSIEELGFASLSVKSDCKKERKEHLEELPSLTPFPVEGWMFSSGVFCATVSSSGQNLKITVQSERRILWTDVSLKLLNGSFFKYFLINELVVVCLFDGYFYAFDTFSGRRLLPAVLLNESVHRVFLETSLLTFIGVAGDVFVLDIAKRRTLFSSSFGKFISSIRNSHVVSAGFEDPDDSRNNQSNSFFKILFSNNLSLKYHVTDKKWFVDSDPAGCLSEIFSSFFNSAISSSENILAAAADLLKLSSDEVLALSLSDIEDRMSSCLLCRRFDLYILWCRPYASLLFTAGTRLRIRGFLSEIAQLICEENPSTDSLNSLHLANAPIFTVEFLKELFGSHMNSLLLKNDPQLKEEIEEIINLLL